MSIPFLVRSNIDSDACPNRDGKEWAHRRSALNKLFLKHPTYAQYTPVFNQVISDILEDFDQRMVECGGSSKVFINDLELKLYNFSIECECQHKQCLCNTAAQH